MRLLLEGVVTATEAQELSAHRGRVGFGLPLVSRIKNLVIANAPSAAVTDESYAVIEQKIDGHQWHYDTGDKGHMPWCKYSCSVLLTNDFEGGLFQFDDPFEEYKHYLSALIYSSDQLHRVTPHRGVRKALLIFLGERK